MNIDNLTRRELARCFGCTERTVSRWVGLGMPRTAKKYDLTACIKWRTEQLQSDKKADPNRQLERLRRHKADLAKLEYAKRAGELVSRAAVVDGTRAMILAAKTKLLSLPSEIGNQLSGTVDREIIAAVTATVKRVVHQALNELAAGDGDDPAEGDK